MDGYCGIKRSECKALEATQKNDDNLRKMVAEDWSKIFNGEIKPEDINCTGCKSNGVQFAHCGECKIRECAEEKGLENCGFCGEFPCGELDFILENVPQAKAVLESIHKSR